MNAATNGTAARALRVEQKAADLSALQLAMVDQPQPEAPAGHAVVRIGAAAVNPSDVKATLGLMPKAVWPRTPGRDFAGTVVAGPSAWIGREVYGSGGDVGITRDGSHARYLVLPEAALRERERLFVGVVFDEVLADFGPHELEEEAQMTPDRVVAQDGVALLRHVVEAERDEERGHDGAQPRQKMERRGAGAGRREQHRDPHREITSGKHGGTPGA